MQAAKRKLDSRIAEEQSAAAALEAEMAELAAARLIVDQEAAACQAAAASLAEAEARVQRAGELRMQGATHAAAQPQEVDQAINDLRSLLLAADRTSDPERSHAFAALVQGAYRLVAVLESSGGNKNPAPSPDPAGRASPHSPTRSAQADGRATPIMSATQGAGNPPHGGFPAAGTPAPSPARNNPTTPSPLTTRTAQGIGTETPATERQPVSPPGRGRSRSPAPRARRDPTVEAAETSCS